jgi:GT2 family glycosyltransferase
MTESLNLNFAAFVITKDRPFELTVTIKKLLNQTYPPNYILVIDNGLNNESRECINNLKSTRISHYSVGNNSGPAGGAYWGMKMLFDKGYDWVLWVDDDDPPKFNDLIKELFEIIQHNDNELLGMVGSVGERFDRKKGKILRLNDEQLTGFLEVDTISGNMFPLVSKRVYDKGLLPSKNLFFGFEDLDFGLSIKRAGFKIITSGDLHLKHRKLAGRQNLKKNIGFKRSIHSIWREYYSVRSLIYILFYKEKSMLATVYCIFRNLIKSFVVFKYGMYYGKKSSRMILLGLFDGIFKRMGMRISPIPKV